MTGHYDLVVVGAGSGGLGAALATARFGRRVLLVERAPELGGTAAWMGVNTWEPVAGATGLPFEIYRRLKQRPGAVGIYSVRRHVCWPQPGEPVFPGGENVIDPDRCYADTLQRHGFRSLAADAATARRLLHGVTFEPAAYQQVVTELLAEADCDVRVNTGFEAVDQRDGRMLAVRLSGGEVVRASAFVDATADANLCAAAGCETMLGEDPRARFGEPSAPEEPRRRVNGVSLIYRITPSARAGIAPLPPGVPAECWWRERFPHACFNQYPCGDWNVNMLPTMEGEEFLALGPAAYDECRRRIAAHWHHVQTIFDEFREYRVAWVARGLGVRESRRVVGEYVLREGDLVAGLAGQDHEDIIAIADHPFDTHGGRGGCGEVLAPYGIPFRCLVPRGYRNLLVACRGASFSSLAASSCRLSRTMMQLGQAAGTAVGLALQLGCDPAAVPSEELRAALAEAHVQLDWPPSVAIRRHIGEE